jgi:hypothetical protein
VLGIDGVRGDLGGARAEAEVAWRAEKKAARRTTAAAGRRATREIAGKLEVVHMAGQSGGGARQRNRGEGERGRRRRTQLQIPESTGTLL